MRIHHWFVISMVYAIVVLNVPFVLGRSVKDPLSSSFFVLDPLVVSSLATACSAAFSGVSWCPANKTIESMKDLSRQNECREQQETEILAIDYIDV